MAMARVIALLSGQVAWRTHGADLWPPSLQGAPDTWGDFGAEWQMLAGDFAAHGAWGGRTVARRATAKTARSKLLVMLPGTFTIPAEFSVLLKYSLDLGFDTVGLDYAWGPAPGSARSEACGQTSSCSSCWENYRERLLSGGGEDLVSGQWPVFGNVSETLRFTHFFSSGWQVLPEFRPPEGVDLAGPVPEGTRSYIEGMPKFSVEPLLARVLQHLQWSEYLTADREVQWAQVFVVGHSQGASVAGYAAFKRPVLGALLLSGPQDGCRGDGVAVSEPPRKHVYGCYAVDEPAAAVIESNLRVFNEYRTINATGQPRDYGAGAWCPPPAHCATAVDDQLVNESVERCFSLMSEVLDEGGGLVSSSIGLRAAALGALGAASWVGTAQVQ